MVNSVRSWLSVRVFPSRKAVVAAARGAQLGGGIGGRGFLLRLLRLGGDGQRGQGEQGAFILFFGKAKRAHGGGFLRCRAVAQDVKVKQGAVPVGAFEQLVGNIAPDDAEFALGEQQVGQALFWHVSILHSGWQGGGGGAFPISRYSRTAFPFIIPFYQSGRKMQ